MFTILFWIGRKVPSIDLVLPELNPVDVFHFRDGLMFPLQRSGRRVHLRKALLHMVDLVMFPFLVSGQLFLARIRGLVVDDDIVVGRVGRGRRFNNFLILVNGFTREPGVETTVEPVVVDVKFVVRGGRAVWVGGWADFDDLRLV